MTDEFQWHAAALKGTRGPISADEPESGFYRQKRKDGTYEPVAYWKDSQTGEQRCHINGKSPQDPLRMFEVWPYASKNPITEGAYWHRIDTGLWLDSDPAAVAAAKGPEIDPGTQGASAEESLKLEITKAVKAAEAYKTIDSDEQAAKAQTLRSALTSFKGDAQKKYESWSRPLLDEIETIRKTWFPIRDAAGDAADGIRKAMGHWEDVKRENAKRVAEEAAKAAQEQEWAFNEAVAKAAVANEPPPEPPKPAPPPPNTAAIPAPSTKIKGASGRAASVQLKKVVTAIDIDKAFAQFRDDPELYAFLLDLSQRVVTAGFVAVGATVEEKSDIR